MTTHFPAYTAKDLNGKTVTLPGDIPGPDSVLIVAFKREQQQIVDGWLAALRPLFADFPHLEYVEVPVIPELNRALRWWIDRGMRSAIEEWARRARVVTLYVDRERFRRQLSIPGEEEVYLYLVNRSGEIRWSTHGVANAAALASLRETLARARNATEPS